jgi:hypothetical protein
MASLASITISGRPLCTSVGCRQRGGSGPDTGKGSEFEKAGLVEEAADQWLGD